MAAIDFDKEDIFFVENDNGRVKCDILFSFQDEYGFFVVFTDGSKTENGKTRAFAARYDPDISENILLPIENEEDIEYVNEAFNYSVRRNNRRTRRDVYGVRHGRYAWYHKPIFRRIFSR